MDKREKPEIEMIETLDWGLVYNWIWENHRDEIDMADFENAILEYMGHPHDCYVQMNSLKWMDESDGKLFEYLKLIEKHFPSKNDRWVFGVFY